MLCDLYVPSEFLSAQHLRDRIAPADLHSSLSSVSFWWIARFLLLLLLRTAYDEVTVSTSQEGLWLQCCLRQGEEDYQDFHWEPERSRKPNIVNKDSKSATAKDTARIGTECRFWSRAGIAKARLKIPCLYCQLGGREGGEHQGGSQAKVDILRVSSKEYLYYFDQVLIRGQPI